VTCSPCCIGLSDKERKSIQQLLHLLLHAGDLIPQATAMQLHLRGLSSTAR
jgi:hypothetical protein